MDNNNFQRLGSISNTKVGSDFEDVAKAALLKAGLRVEPRFSIAIGVAERRKGHRFDLGAASPKVIVECKSHRWTTGGNMPSAKMTVWNEAMYYFAIAPKDFRKILFVLRDYNERREATLAEYYIKIYLHLIPDEVEVWEYDDNTGNVSVLKQALPS